MVKKVVGDRGGGGGGCSQLKFFFLFKEKEVGSWLLPGVKWYHRGEIPGRKGFVKKVRFQGRHKDQYIRNILSV